MLSISDTHLLYASILFVLSDISLIVSNTISGTFFFKDIVYLGGSDLETAKNISERLNAPLEKVLYLPLGDIIVFRRGSYPIIDRRYPIFEDKEYKKAVLLAKRKRNNLAHVSTDSSSRVVEETAVYELDDSLQADLERKFDELFGPVE